MKYSSEWQTPAAVTLIRTSPGPGSGVGTSRISGGLPIAVYCRAFMPCPHARPQVGTDRRIILPTRALGEVASGRSAAGRGDGGDQRQGPGELRIRERRDLRRSHLADLVGVERSDVARTLDDRRPG